MTRMFRSLVGIGVIAALAVSAPAQAAADTAPGVRIAVDPTSPSPVRIAAAELREGLAKLYPDETFAVTAPGEAAAAGRAIYVGTPETLKAVAGIDSAVKRLHGPGSYVVSVSRTGGRAVGLIVGADGSGAVYGVHGLLGNLGFGYALDGDIAPAQRKGAMGFDQWELADRPLAPRRFVLNWHNFLSSCSTWNIEHWQRWIAQSQKMGYNAVMVHAYGNNPMAGFSFEGVDKPVGYLSSTRIGRDWGTQHVNDVRRLIGGEAFDSPVFGSTASVDGTDAQRTGAARKLMGEAFAEARRRGVDVIFAVDIDTSSANPQSLIMKLPADARFNVGATGKEFYLPRPDTPGGYSYYKAEVAALLGAYPQIDTLVLWFRAGSTPLTNVRLEQLPDDWQKEYRAVAAKEPAVANYWRSVAVFAMSKVAGAFEKALKELGRDDVTLGLGSWAFNLLAASDRFMPKHVGLYPLDYGMLSGPPYLTSPENAASLAAVAAHRPVYPVLWAHHDDGKYTGPPFTPPENFYDLLARAKCDSAGFGIIHWTTRPLDAFFASLSDAVWASGRNQSAEASCGRMAKAMLGQANERLFGQYLHEWLTGLPMIGRATTARFIDRELKGHDEALASHKKRIALLDRLDQAGLSPLQHKRVAYFRGYERFILSVFENESHYRQAISLQKQGDVPGARAALARADVPAAVRLYADTAGLLGISRGEQGLIVSLNLRWYAHYLRLAQQLGAEAVRINFAPTSHDPLAQSAGSGTYFVGRDGRFWDVRGEQETKAPAYSNLAGYVEKADPNTDALWEVRQSGLVSDKPISLDVTPVMGGNVAAGHYRLTLLFGKAPAGQEGPRTMDAAVYVPGRKDPLTGRVSLADSPVDKAFEFDLARDGIVQVRLTPVAGKAMISGLVLDPK